MKLEDEPIWTRRMAAAFNEWAARYSKHPEKFNLSVDIKDYGYLSALYMIKLLKELDAEGKAPRATKIEKEFNPPWVPYSQSGITD